MKKIYVMRGRDLYFYFLWALVFVYFLIVLYATGDDIIAQLKRDDAFFQLSLWALIVLPLPTAALYVNWKMYERELFYSVIDEKGYQSVRFGKRYCFVDKRMEIFYSITEDPDYETTYVVFSNEPFVLCTLTKDILGDYVLPFSRVYDYRKMIVLPYDETTMLEFDIENWIPVKVVQYGNRNRRTKCIEDAGYPRSIQRAEELDRKLKSIFKRKKDK